MAKQLQRTQNLTLRQCLSLLLTDASAARINFLIGLFISLAAMVGLSAVVTTGNFNNNGAGIFMLFWLALGAYLISDAFIQTIRSHKVKAFARLNGFDLITDHRTRDYPGMFFMGEESRVVNALRTAGANFVEIGNFQLIRESGRDSRFRRGYVRMKLPRRLPHMVLIAKNSVFNMPASTDANQRLSLEGDFDKHFTLYAPLKYKVDALYVFTPDIMELFMTKAGQFTCEIVDDELILYANVPFELSDETVVAKILQLLNTVAPKFNHQIDYYADERVGDRRVNIISVPGRRLRAHFAPVFVTTVIFALIAGATPTIIKLVQDWLKL